MSRSEDKNADQRLTFVKERMFKMEAAVHQFNIYLQEEQLLEDGEPDLSEI